MIFVPGKESSPSKGHTVYQFTLTMQTPQGTGMVVPDVGDHEYMEGRDIMLVASPGENGCFIRWEGEGVQDTESSTTSIKMSENRTVRAFFEEEVVLTLVATGGGTTVPDPSSAITYIKNSVANIKAVPYEGFDFKGWNGDASGETDIVNITMDVDKTIGAVFVQKATKKDSKKKLYFATVKEKAYWNVDGIWQFFATPIHGLLKKLDADDHPQYLNETRHDTTDRHALGTVVPHDSHDNLSNNGAYTHEQIDGHIDDVTGNPHQVTAEQTGALPEQSDTTLPTASTDYRGRFFTVTGSAGPPAVPDKLYYCRSTDGGTTYEWKEVSLV